MDFVDRIQRKRIEDGEDRARKKLNATTDTVNLVIRSAKDADRDHETGETYCNTS